MADSNSNSDGPIGFKAPKLKGVEVKVAPKFGTPSFSVPAAAAAPSVAARNQTLAPVVRRAATGRVTEPVVKKTEPVVKVTEPIVPSLVVSELPTAVTDTIGEGKVEGEVQSIQKSLF